MSFPIGINTGLAENYQTDEQVNMKVYENVVPSVVSIDADLSDGISSGTGVVIDPKGLILTSSHVIEGSDEIKVMVNGGKEYNGKVLSVVDAGDDLALIRINPDKQIGRAHV